MKINYTQIITFLFTILLTIYLMVLISCSPNYHMRKFIKKGGVIEQTEKVVTLHDTIKGKDGKDSIIYRTVSIECPEPIIPKTRWQTRIEYRYRYKAIRDSFETIRYVTKWKVKESVKQAKNTKKRGLAYNIRFLGIILGLLILIVYLLRTNK